MKPLPGQLPSSTVPGHVPWMTSSHERSGTPPVAFLMYNLRRQKNSCDTCSKGIALTGFGACLQRMVGVMNRTAATDADSTSRTSVIRRYRLRRCTKPVTMPRRADFAMRPRIGVKSGSAPRSATGRSCLGVKTRIETFIQCGLWATLMPSVERVLLNGLLMAAPIRVFPALPQKIIGRMPTRRTLGRQPARVRGSIGDRRCPEQVPRRARSSASASDRLTVSADCRCEAARRAGPIPPPNHPNRRQKRCRAAPFFRTRICACKTKTNLLGITR